MKKLLIAFLIGLGIFFSYTTLASHSYSQVFAQADVQLDFGGIAKDKEVIGTADYNPADGGAGFGALIGRILNIVIVIAALMLFLMLLWGGFEWITSGGDKGKTESARNKITAAVLGLIVLAAAWAILGLVLKFLGAGDLNSLIDQL